MEGFLDNHRLLDGVDPEYIRVIKRSLAGIRSRVRRALDVRDDQKLVLYFGVNESREKEILDLIRSALKPASDFVLALVFRERNGESTTSGEDVRNRDYLTEVYPSPGTNGEFDLSLTAADAVVSRESFRGTKAVFLGLPTIFVPDQNPSSLVSYLGAKEAALFSVADAGVQEKLLKMINDEDVKRVLARGTLSVFHDFCQHVSVVWRMNLSM